jgi:two-component system, NtrC family, sensor histidine kinase GlrK
MWRRMRLGTRLGLTHGALVALLMVLLVVMLQGLLRMLAVMSTVSAERLSTLDAEEELHRAAWGIELALRHGRLSCANGESESLVRKSITDARAAFLTSFASHGAAAPARQRDAAAKYETLADESLSVSPCTFLSSPASDRRRTLLDEEMTDAWIDRLQELHSDVKATEQRARSIGQWTALSGVVVAVLGAVSAIVVATSTARSITRPIARLAADATRLGEGSLAEPITAVGGPPEIEGLRRNLERTREKLLGVDRLKQAFLASVSHELRSPLGRLREALALLGDGIVGELTPEQSRVVDLAGRACEQEVRIVEALLDMSRVSSGLPVQREAGCDIERVVAAAVESEQPAALERGVDIRVIREGVPPTLTLDSALIERAVANLVRNAVSVSPRKGEVRVVIGVRGTGDEGIVRVDVIDEGPGVGASIVGRIFQPFTAVGVEKAQRPAGIGLGLSLAREVARAHGGDLELARAETATTFRLELPVDVPRREELEEHPQ